MAWLLIPPLPSILDIRVQPSGALLAALAQHKTMSSSVASLGAALRPLGLPALTRDAPALGHWPHRQRQRRHIVAAPLAAGGGGGDKPNFGDDLLDFMYAGKKLRKWYGAEGMVLPRDGQRGDDDDGGSGGEPAGGGAPDDYDDSAPREYIAVLDADSSPMAEQVLLQLILERVKIRALVRDVAAARTAFGPYLEGGIVKGDSSDGAAVAALLRGAKAAVCCGKLGALLPAAAATKLPHLVLLAGVGAGPAPGGPFGSLFASGEQQALGDGSREAQLRASGVPHTIVQVGRLTDVPGGASSLAITGVCVCCRFQCVRLSGSCLCSSMISSIAYHLNTDPTARRPLFAAGGTALQGWVVGREDAARALAEAAQRDAAAGSLVVQLCSGGVGEPPEDWQAAFSELLRVRSA